MQHKDIMGNILKPGNDVVIADGEGRLQKGTVEDLSGVCVGVVVHSIRRDLVFWRRSEETSKLFLEKESGYTKAKTKSGKPIAVSNKRIENIIKAIPGVKWNPNSVRVTIKGYGDKPAFQISGNIKRLIGGKHAVIKWHTHTPGGGHSRFYFWYKGKITPMKATLTNGQEVLQKIITLLEEEK